MLIRRILSSQWDEATWPFAKAELAKGTEAAWRARSGGLVELDERGQKSILVL